MKLQLAIDRLPLGQALVLAARLENTVDIVEVGTSLIKDYGMLALREFAAAKTKGVQLLADMKIMDEAAYEAEAAFANGADIVTVMGVASEESICAVAKAAKAHQKDYMIDMMNVDAARAQKLYQAFDGIFCLHLPTDAKGDIAAFAQQSNLQQYPQLRFAIAGGVNLQALPAIGKAGFAVAIVGGAITKDPNPQKAAAQFKEAML